MPAVRPIPDAGELHVPINGPAETPVNIDGKAYLVRTWTREQWAMTLVGDRPKDAWRHGFGYMQIIPI